MNHMVDRLLGCLCASLVFGAGASAADQGGYGGGGNFNFDLREDSEQQVLQRATSLAIGNLAWETVNVSDVRKAGGKVSWTATMRSNVYRCNAEANGDGSACDRVSSVSPEGPPAPRNVPAANRAPAAAVVPQVQRNMVTVGGRDRPYLYYVPLKYTRDGFNSVVYALHDNGQTPQQFAEQSGWLKLADQHGFAVVFPEAERNTWAANSGGEDAYIRAVYDHAVGHLRAPDAAGAGAGPGARGEGGQAPRGEGGQAPRGEGGQAPRGEGGQASPGAGQAPRGEGQAARPGGAAGGQAGAQAGGQPARMGISTWVPFHYVTGAGAGATVAQEFAMNYPGIFAALATLDGGVYAASYAKGEERAQDYYQYSRAKNAEPVWKQLKKEVPVASWLFTSGSPTPAETKQVDYWKRSNSVAASAQSRAIDGLSTSIYRNAANEYQQVRTTVLADSAKYDPAMAGAIWRDFFSTVARWTSSPNGDLGSLLSEEEVTRQFDVRTLTVDGATYTYYLKTPSSYRKGQSLPLVIAAGGGSFPARLYLSQIKMHEVGEKERFITVYTNGQRNMWNFRQPDSADAKFIRGMIDDVIKTYGADKSRVYMQGFSLGSGMSYMMGITHPQLFAAVSPNNGIGPMTPEVTAWAANVKQKGDARIPMMMVFGDVDGAASVDAKFPAQGVLRGALDEMKKYNNLAGTEQVVKFDSPYSAPYDVLVLGGTAERKATDARYPDGRFVINTYSSNDRKPLPLFSFVWVTDLPHGADPRTAQLEWDYFKQWRRNADGSLTFTAR
jgi:poly(3-hydroxybutyrate) depolymerase